MLVGTLCMSHSPLMDTAPVAADVRTRFDAALARVRTTVADLRPDLAVIFYPDHVNGFFYGLLPSFCVGIEGESIGDFGTAAGRLAIPEAIASDLAAAVVDDGVDTALSHRMAVDHGAVQPIEILAESGKVLSFIPVFVNCAAAPRPTFARVRALGAAVGRWAASRPERILVIASGGLSHDPPLPNLADADAATRERLVAGGPLPYARRVERQKRTLAEGAKMVAGTSTLRPLNPAWDLALLDAFAAGDLTTLDGLGDEAISGIGGRGAHEVRAWIAALAAQAATGAYAATLEFYAPIDEWITGMGILTALARPAATA